MTVANEVFVSAANLWEIAIKYALARGRPNDMPVSAEQARAYFEQAGYGLLDITPAQVVAVDALPKLRADPFDRILIAQALMVPLRLLTRDARIARYGGVVIAV